MLVYIFNLKQKFKCTDIKNSVLPFTHIFLIIIVIYSRSVFTSKFGWKVKYIMVTPLVYSNNHDYCKMKNKGFSVILWDKISQR